VPLEAHFSAAETGREPLIAAGWFFAKKVSNFFHTFSGDLYMMILSSGRDLFEASLSGIEAPRGFKKAFKGIFGLL
jgi:hypothetical protein